MSYPGPIISAEWLCAHLGDPKLLVVDATVHLPDTARDAHAEYTAEHIPNAVFFDFGRIADPENPLPRRFPPPEIFRREVGALGIDNQTHVVAYDSPGLYSAARVWWMFRQYGYDNVSVLDGGLKVWKSDGYPVEAGEVTPSPKPFTLGRPRGLLARWPDVLKASNERTSRVLDARTPGRFSGTEIDRYPGARPGHIPGSLNLYWAELLDSQNRTFLPVDLLRSRFERAGLSLNEAVTVSCGSGLTACILALGLHLVGHNKWQVYDGSWEEWGGKHELPVETASTGRDF